MSKSNVSVRQFTASLGCESIELMYYFCTYFDQHYLPRGLALYHSLQDQCPAFKLWVLCMDHEAFRLLTQLQLPNVIPIALEEFERNDELLLSAKQNRSTIEYYFTCTPSLPLYILDKWQEVDLITYLDADLFLFSNPQPLFDEMQNGSIGIIGHRFSAHLLKLEIHGIYNVGWLMFRRDSNALACLQWWRERCIEWCYDRLEGDRYADQKYLDDWPQRFQNVVVLQHKGANVAPWNLGNYHLSYQEETNTVFIDEQPLIFFHFHALKKLQTWLYDAQWEEYRIVSTPVLRLKIYAIYIRALTNAHRQLSAYSRKPLLSGEIRSHAQKAKDHNGNGLVAKVRSRVGRSVLTLQGQYLLYVGGRVIYFRERNS